MMAENFKNPIYVTPPLLPDLGKFKAKLGEVWDSQWLTNNSFQHQLLEKRLKDFLKVPYISLFDNGTTALMVACRALGLSGKVITTPFTFPATPHALTWNGIEPVFCDVDPETMNIDVDKIEELITEETSAIMPVHVFGRPCNCMGIQQIADKHGLKIIYDAAHAFGVDIEDEGIGNFGDATMFSFHATKLFHTIEGGALTFKDTELKHKVDLLKNFGIKNEEEIILPGLNGKMNEMQATMGLMILDVVNEERKKRKNLADAYRRCLNGVQGVTLSPESTSYQYFVIKIDEKSFGKSRDYVCEKFKEYNVFTRKYFYPLCSSYPHYKDLSSSKNLPIANKVVKETLSMPFYGELSVDDIENICDILKSFQSI